MNRKRLLTLTLVTAVALIMLTASLAAASAPARQAVSADLLRIASEETGMIAAETAVSPQCTYDARYTLYLCPEAAPTVLPQPDAAAHAAALRLLGTGGLLLIPESTNDRVMAFDPVTGNLVDADFIPADPTHLATPIHAILGPNGNAILISDQVNKVVQEYDMEGNFVGTFAGGDTSILDNIRGIALRPNGNLLVTVGAGANDDAVAEFDTTGAYVGNFVANAAGGLDSPFDVYGRASDWLVNGITSDAIHRYDLSGVYLDNLTAIDTFPEQAAEASNGNVLVANFSGTQEGVVEYTAAGAFVGLYNPVSLGGYRGVYELPNGNILTTNGGGVHEIDRSGNLVATKISGVSARFIEFLPPPASIGLAKTIGVDPHSCADTNSITVVGASNLTYCYTVTNTGSITLTTHSLVDDQLGTILASLPYTLTPGSSVFVTNTASLTQTTVNTAIWTASDNGITVTAMATASVTLLNPAIILTKTVGTEAANCADSNSITVETGTTVYYCYAVMNTGDVALNLHDLADSELGTVFMGLTYVLTPGAAIDTVAAGLTVSATITGTTTNTATWTAYNDSLVMAAATATATVTVPDNFAVYLPLILRDE